MSLSLACLSFLTLLATVAPPWVVIRHDRTDAQALERAKPYAQAVQVSADGCGTLIAPDWVLTAAHVALSISPFVPTVRVEDEDYGIARVVLHPRGIPDDPTRPPPVDLALLQLDRGVEDGLVAGLHRADDEHGREVLVVGYGDFGVGDGELRPTDGRRRAVTNVIDGAEDGRLVITFDAPPAGTELEGMGAPGDSGGPLLMVDGDRVSVAGVSSASSGGPAGQYRNRDIYVRISDFADWIDETLADPPPSMLDLPEPIDLGDGFPDTPEAGLLQAFFEAYASGDEAGLAAFSREHRLYGARRDKSDESWATQIAGLREDLGSLTPRKLAAGNGPEWQVLASSPDGGELLMMFLIQQRDGPKLDGLGIDG